MLVSDESAFTEDFTRRVSEDLRSSRTANETWEALKKHTIDAIKHTQVAEPPKKQLWMTDETLILIERRRLLKASGITEESEQAEYSNLNRLVQKNCRRDKNLYLQEMCRDIQSFSDINRSKDLFTRIRLITKNFKAKSWNITKSDGTTATGLDEVVEAWKSYCQDLYSDTPSFEPPQVSQQSIELEPDILRAEVEAAINKLRTGKAPGIDPITTEIIKLMGEEGVNILHKTCSQIWSCGKWPEDWLKSVFIPIHKKGSVSVCDNYRLVALIPHASKVMLHILLSRMSAFISWQISPTQAGFVKGKGTRQQILNIRQLIEKSREFNVPMYLCFVDYSKAFDNVRWKKLWITLKTMGVPEHLINLTKELYTNNSATVKIDNCLSSDCTVAKGVRQECILSPLFFNAYGEVIMRNVLEDWTGGVSVGGVRISNLRYADDTTLIASSEDELIEILARLQRCSSDFGLDVNFTKTKIMVIDRPNNNRPNIRRIGPCEVVNRYTYLGTIVTNTGECEPEIRRRIQLGRTAMTQLQKIWKDRNVSLSTKIMLVNSLVFPVFLYASETWTVKAADRRRINAFEMWCWRRLLRIPWTARRTNDSVLNEIKPETRLSNIVDARVLSFLGHVMRDENSVERLIVQGNTGGKRSRGRSPRRWTDTPKELLKTNMEGVVRLAAGRQRWRDAVRRVTRQPN